MSSETTEKIYSRDDLKNLMKDKLKHRATRIRKAIEEQKKRSMVFVPKIIENDPFIGKYDNVDTETGLSLIQPRFPFHILKNIVENSDVTGAIIDAMKKNIEGFGFGLRFLGDDVEASSPANAANKTELDDFFNYANESESFVTLTAKKRHDMEHLGCGALEIQRSENGEIAAAYHLPMELIRGTTLEKNPTPVEYNIRRKGKIVPVTFMKYFRRFAQIGYDGTIQRFFKEYGDPRSISAKTGKVEVGLPPAEQATEIFIDTIFAGNYLYGLPRWMGAIMDVLGRRNAQHVNWDLFESQGIPRMVVMVSGGTLTEESYGALEDLLLEAQGIANYNKVTLLEANSDALGIDDKANTARIDFKNLSEARQDDQMFTRYLETTEKSIRGVFRLPPLYLGGVDTYNLATAKAAALVAESQVFIPERLLSDEKVNRRIIQNGFNIHDWVYYNKSIRITGAEEIASVVKSFAKTGAFTINHAIAQANEAFGLTMSQFKEDWANYPYDIVMELLRSGKLKGLDKITEKVIDENAGKLKDFQNKNGLDEINVLEDNDTKEKSEALRHMIKPKEFTLYKTIETLRTALKIISKNEEQFKIGED